ncbi:hypothetical protein NCCP2495_12690 [Dietzia sp. NCCP-2495]|nr:hypothetical protein NCCP2495_12690 [Dietzia sp. NCCP-2495]
MLVVVVVLLAGLALVVGATGALAMAGKLPGNDILGVRTPETRKSPEAWDVANRAAGPAFLGSGLTLLLGTVALPLVGGWVGGIVVVVAVVISFALLNVAGIAGARAAAIWDDAQPDEGGCGCGPDGCGGHPGESEAGGCSPAGDAGAGHADAGCEGGAADPARDCGVTGGCGSCALQSMCETGTAGR